MTKEKKTKQPETGRAVLCAILAVIVPPIGLPLAIINAIVTSKEKKAKQGQTTKQAQTEQQTRRQPEERKAFHSHTPVEYSYDTCAAQKRLEQLDVLYQAGLYTKAQYLEAKAKMLKA